MGASPLVTYWIEDPTPSILDDTQLKITERRGSQEDRGTSYVFNPTSAYWTISRTADAGSIRFSTSGGGAAPLVKKTLWLDGGGVSLFERQITTDTLGRVTNVKTGNIAASSPLIEERFLYQIGDSPAYEQRYENNVLVSWTRTITNGEMTSICRPYLDGPIVPLTLEPNGEWVFLEQGATSTSKNLHLRNQAGNQARIFNHGV